MKAQTQFFTAAAATAIAGLVSAAPAQAFSFKTDDLIQGDGTSVNFTFHQSHGAFQSEWGVYNNTTDTFYSLFQEVQSHDRVQAVATDNKGTCGITVIDCNANFIFEAGNEYSFFLRNLNNTGHQKTVFSANELNPIQRWTKFENQVKFFSDLSVLEDASYATSASLTSDLAKADSESFSLASGMTALIAFEDQGKDPSTGQYFHGDWNDFMVTATVAKPAALVPEPATLLGLGVVMGAMTLFRRRKEDKVS
jgi:hypothetical protein